MNELVHFARLVFLFIAMVAYALAPVIAVAWFIGLGAALHHELHRREDRDT